MRFSQRIGIRPAQLEVQVDSISSELRTSLWNVLVTFYIRTSDLYNEWEYSQLHTIAELSQINFFKRPLDEFYGMHGGQYVDQLKRWFFGAEWYEIYDFIEWAGSFGAHWESWNAGNEYYENAKRFRSAINSILTREMSAYRFVDAKLVTITSESELSEIECAAKQQGKFSPVSQHISTSITFLASRRNPDFRNSIKESVSAVEATAKIITGDKNASLGLALKLLEKKRPLHGSLKEGFQKLYGWTSDGDGIRHALMSETAIDQREAHFMLIVCSAFSNYLIDAFRE